MPCHWHVLHHRWQRRQLPHGNQKTWQPAIKRTRTTTTTTTTTATATTPHISKVFKQFNGILTAVATSVPRLAPPPRCHSGSPQHRALQPHVEWQAMSYAYNLSTPRCLPLPARHPKKDSKMPNNNSNSNNSKKCRTLGRRRHCQLQQQHHWDTQLSCLVAPIKVVGY